MNNNNQNVWTIGMTGSALIGAGLTKIDVNFTVGISLVAIGVGLQILVAVLNKYNIPVSTPTG